MTTYEQAEAAITDMFSDTTVPISVAKENLRGLIEHLETLLDSLPDEEED
jgi:hypothetical protein